VRTTTLEQPEAQRTEDDDDLDHYICSEFPNVAFCGTDVSASPWVDESVTLLPTDCSMCVYVWETAGELCPVCKKDYYAHA
jgi:hypothetical protein